MMLVGPALRINSGAFTRFMQVSASCATYYHRNKKGLGHSRIQTLAVLNLAHRGPKENLSKKNPQLRPICHDATLHQFVPDLELTAQRSIWD